MKPSLQRLSVLLWLNRQRSRDGKAGIYLRITIDGKRTELFTQHYVHERAWDSGQQVVLPNASDAEFINGELLILKASIVKQYNVFKALGKNPTAEQLKGASLGTTEQESTVKQLLEFYIKRFSEKVKLGRKAANSLKCLRSTEKKVLAFLKHHFKRNDICLSDIKPAFAEDFEHYLLTIDKVSSNTAMKYIKVVKRVLKTAIRQGWLEKNPIDGFKCPYEEPQRERLTMTEIMHLYNFEFTSKRLGEVRDVFLFSCFTGFAYQDVADLTPANIVIGIDGEKWIVKDRHKTNSAERVPLLPFALDILAKYKDDPYCIAYEKLLPVNSNQKYNAYLKEVTKECSIHKHLTTHTARHTFATTITLEHDVPIETVSQMLGHKSIRTTQLYAKITQMKVSNNMKALRDKLKMNTSFQVVNGER
jgi:site-specific recombinase XerD